MNGAQKEEMILDFLEGNLTEAEAQTFSRLLENGTVQQQEIEDVMRTLASCQAMPTPEPGPGLEFKFNGMLAAQIERAELAKPQLSWAALWSRLGEVLNPVSLAYSVLVFGVGFLAAWLVLSPEKHDDDTQVMASELRQVKQLLFTTLIEQPAAADRLKAVNFSHEIVGADGKVIEALFHSLNEDPNVNVRLAAIEALKVHTAKPAVREKLIRSINQQESPIVQIALADLMQALQEKNALPQLRRLLEKETTNELVKDKLKESINILI